MKVLRFGKILFIFITHSPFFPLLPSHIRQMTECGMEFNGMICRHLSQKG